MEARIHGRKHRWETYGEGPPVILLHGIPTSPAVWRHVVPLLDGMQVHAWEMLGYGASMDTPEEVDIGLAAQAQYLAEWMDHQEIPAAVLVGHDLGGGVAHILAARHPTRCTGLVLTNAVGYDSWPIPSVKAMRAMAPLVERLPEEALKAVLTSFIHRGHDNGAMAKESADIHLAPYLTDRGPDAFARQVRSLDVQDTLDVAEHLKHLDVPAQIVWGAADGFQKIAYGRRFAEDLRAPLVTVDKGLHFMPEDHPHEVAAGIRAVVMERKMVPPETDLPTPPW